MATYGRTPQLEIMGKNLEFLVDREGLAYVDLMWYQYMERMDYEVPWARLERRSV